MKNGVEDFVVESTPVLDLKKHGLSPQSVAKDANWDSDRTEVYSDADGEAAVASLIGEQGEVFPITTFPFVIGRGSECDLVLQGKGVSRRHAEIIFQSGRFVVNDLESLNGIKVNGYKVSRVILEENDNIRLGEVALTFRSKAGGTGVESPTKTSSARPGLFGKKKSVAPAVPLDDTFGPSPLKKLATQTAIAVAVGLVGVAGYQYWVAQNQPQGRIVEASPGASVPSPQVQKPAPAAPAPAPRIEEPPAPSVASAPSTSSPDPVAKPEPVVQASSSARQVDAVEPPPSLAPPPSIARVPVSQPAAPRPSAPVSRPAPAPISQPAPRESQTTSSTPPREFAGADQARQDLVRAQDLYFKGDAQNAIALLKPLVESSALPQGLKAEVRTAYANYSTLYNQYGAGQSAYVNGDKEGAFQTWNAFMDKEAATFGGRKSAYTQNISSRVVGEYVTLGNDASRSGDHHKAYRMWQKALELGDNVAARIAIDNANNKAMQLYRQALRLEYVNTSKARALWQEVTELLPPGTEYHTKASAKLAWYDRWGS